MERDRHFRVTHLLGSQRRPVRSLRWPGGRRGPIDGRWSVAKVPKLEVEFEKLKRPLNEQLDFAWLIDLPVGKCAAAGGKGTKVVTRPLDIGL